MSLMTRRILSAHVLQCVSLTDVLWSANILIDAEPIDFLNFLELILHTYRLCIFFSWDLLDPEFRILFTGNGIWRKGIYHHIIWVIL